MSPMLSMVLLNNLALQQADECGALVNCVEALEQFDIACNATRRRFRFGSNDVLGKQALPRGFSGGRAYDLGLPTGMAFEFETREPLEELTAEEVRAFFKRKIDAAVFQHNAIRQAG